MTNQDKHALLHRCLTDIRYYITNEETPQCNHLWGKTPSAHACEVMKLYKELAPVKTELTGFPTELAVRNQVRRLLPALFALSPKGVISAYPVVEVKTASILLNAHKRAIPVEVIDSGKPYRGVKYFHAEKDAVAAFQRDNERVRNILNGTI